ncbi:UPF0202 protein [Platanthera guangdongensis]|uniref:UPF0202 protein n=1 Tax=Platanthera guangdongensis TaxID=2320717 RepID=A0ABR2M4H3_9ASPA
MDAKEEFGVGEAAELQNFRDFDSKIWKEKFGVGEARQLSANQRETKIRESWVADSGDIARFLAFARIYPSRNYLFSAPIRDFSPPALFSHSRRPRRPSSLPISLSTVYKYAREFQNVEATAPATAELALKPTEATQVISKELVVVGAASLSAVNSKDPSFDVTYSPSDDILLKVPVLEENNVGSEKPVLETLKGLLRKEQEDARTREEPLRAALDKEREERRALQDQFATLALALEREKKHQDDHIHKLEDEVKYYNDKYLSVIGERDRSRRPDSLNTERPQSSSRAVRGEPSNLPAGRPAEQPARPTEREMPWITRSLGSRESQCFSFSLGSQRVSLPYVTASRFPSSSMGLCCALCHKKKRAKQVKKYMQRGLLDPEKVDPFSLFVESTNITYCLYKDSERVLGNTFGMCILQDFEALTPNLLARTIETVEGGGLVILLIHSLTSLTSLYTMVMDVHDRFRTESHSQTVPRFNERFLLSIASCKASLVVDDELNILKISSNIRSFPPVAVAEDSEGLSEKERELKNLKEQFHDELPVGPLIMKCCTLDQAKGVVTLLDAVLDKTLRSTVALTAARGRGKSAALGLAVAGAIVAGYSNIFVTAPSPENLKTLFEFICIGLNSLEYKRRAAMFSADLYEWRYTPSYRRVAVDEEAKACTFRYRIRIRYGYAVFGEVYVLHSPSTIPYSIRFGRPLLFPAHPATTLLHPTPLFPPTSHFFSPYRSSALVPKSPLAPSKPGRRRPPSAASCLPTNRHPVSHHSTLLPLQIQPATPSQTPPLCCPASRSSPEPLKYPPLRTPPVPHLWSHIPPPVQPQIFQIWEVQPRSSLPRTRPGPPTTEIPH